MCNTTKAPTFHKATAPNWYAYRAQQGNVALDVVRQAPGKWYAYLYRDGRMEPNITSHEAFTFQGATAECRRAFSRF